MRHLVITSIVGVFVALLTSAQAPSTMPDLIARLRDGGYVLVTRHASSPSEAPSRETARPDNIRRDRQLDEAGRRAATAWGEALRALKIPVATVFTSPEYRAVETVRFAGLSSPTLVEELGEGQPNMQGVTEAQAAWLRAKAAEPPRAGNVIIVTHQPNLTRAFPDWGASVVQGETVVLRPDGRRGFAIAGRVRIEDWTRIR